MMTTTEQDIQAVPTTMRAAVYRGINDVRVETIAVPEIGAGEVLVKIHTCGICGTDLKKIHSGSHEAPRVFGHEMAGTIVRVGEGVDGFAVGDRVMAYHHMPCGDCYYCRKQTFAQCDAYKKVGCTAGFAPSGGGFAEYIRVMDWIVRRGLVKIPDDIPFEQAVFLEPVNTCYKAICSLKLYAERHAVAAKFGLRHPLDARSDVPKAAKAATEGRGADVALLAVGGNALIKTAMDAIRPGGRVLLFAQTQHGEAPFDPAVVCMDEKTLMGSYSSSIAVQDDVTRMVFDGYRSGFDLTNLISHRFSLEEAVAGIDIASHPQADSLKIVIQPGRSN
jgi:L-iditol 2-dehydrogenase